MLPVIKSPDGNITVLVNNCEPYAFGEGHINYKDLMKHVESGDSASFLKSFDVQKELQKSVDVYIVDKDIDLHISNGQIIFNGEVVHNFVCERILEAYRTNTSYKNLLNFLKKLLLNPSRRAVEQLYTFLEHKGMPITDDGDFIAWKSVRADYKDKYSNTIDNSVGKVIEVARNKVDDDYNRHCSHGLHVGALEYSGPGGWYNSAGDKVLAVKVNPADAVAVPSDHSFTKLRVCRYEVIGEHKATPTSDYTDKNNANQFIDNLVAEHWPEEDYDDDYDDDEDDDFLEDDTDDEDYENDYLDDDDDDTSDSDEVVDFCGYYPGEEISFIYKKPGESRYRRVEIDAITQDKVYAHDLDDNNHIKCFRVDRIDLGTVKGL